MTDARAHTLFEVWSYLSLNPRATTRQLARHFGWHSNSTAHEAVASLTKLGYIAPNKRAQHRGRRLIVKATYLAPETN